jgi:dimethylglycine dehydrogenase
VKAEATLAFLPDSDRGTGRIWYGSAAASERHDMDWLRAHVAPGEDVAFRALTNDMTALVLAGPKSRAVLSAVSRGDWSREAFPWLSVRECFVGIAPATVMSVSYSGELAYEIHVPNAQLHAAWRALRQAGEAHGLTLFGARAVEAMRLEKGYLHWKTDLLTEFDPFETGLDRFVKLDKGEFVGKAALTQRHNAGPRKRLVTLAVAAEDRPAHGGASVMAGDRVVGTVTSGAQGHRTGLNLALAFVEPDRSAPGEALAIDLLGDLIPAEVIATGPYDPSHERVRA